MGIKVIAIAKGYYGQFRDPNDASAEFEIDNEQALADWMERLDGKSPKRPKSAAPVQTTGNNPIGGKPHTGADDLPNPADLT